MIGIISTKYKKYKITINVILSAIDNIQELLLFNSNEYAFPARWTSKLK